MYVPTYVYACNHDWLFSLSVDLVSGRSSICVCSDASFVNDLFIAYEYSKACEGFLWFILVWSWGFAAMSIHCKQGASRISHFFCYIYSVKSLVFTYIIEYKIAGNMFFIRSVFQAHCSMRLDWLSICFQLYGWLPTRRSWKFPPESADYWSVCVFYIKWSTYTHSLLLDTLIDNHQQWNWKRI